MLEYLTILAVGILAGWQANTQMRSKDER